MKTLLKPANMIISILVISLMFVYFTGKSDISEAYEINQDLKSQVELAVNSKSKIELIEEEVVTYKEKSEDYKTRRDNLRFEADALDNIYKSSVWASRCWTKNAMLEVQGLEHEDCSADLERFANYNLGK